MPAEPTPGSVGSSAAHPAAGGPRVRAALPADVRRIKELVLPYALRRILIAKDLVHYFEHVQEFLVAEVESGERNCPGPLTVLPAHAGVDQIVGVGLQQRRVVGIIVG